MPDGRDLDRPSRSGVRRKLVLALAVAVAAAAATVANLVLLGSAGASNDPVGRLTPRTHLPAAPQGTVRPTNGRPRDDHADD